MPRNEERTDQTVNSPKAFPDSETQEPKGRTRFGPDPMKPRPTTENVNNTDKAGTAKPWLDPANRL